MSCTSKRKEYTCQSCRYHRSSNLFIVSSPSSRENHECIGRLTQVHSPTGLIAPAAGKIGPYCNGIIYPFAAPISIQDCFGLRHRLEVCFIVAVDPWSRITRGAEKEVAIVAYVARCFMISYYS